MVLKYHASDYKALPNEEAFRAAFKGVNAPPAQYIIPHISDMKQMGSPEHIAKLTEGPVAVLNLRPNGVVGMGKSLGQWFVFSLVVSAFVGDSSRRPCCRWAPTYMMVFHTVGLVAFLALRGGSVARCYLDGEAVVHCRQGSA